jgi:hypothetical protein
MVTLQAVGLRPLGDLMVYAMQSLFICGNRGFLYAVF